MYEHVRRWQLMYSSCKGSVLYVLLISAIQLSAQPIISEVVAENDTVLSDEGAPAVLLALVYRTSTGKDLEGSCRLSLNEDGKCLNSLRKLSRLPEDNSNKESAGNEPALF
jgi:hypothetical protein